jgi:hypothetical protein
MHLVIWKFDVMEGKNRADLMAVIDGTAARCGHVPGLIRKYTTLGPGLKSVIEFYLWTSKAAADAFFDLEWDGETSRAWESARMTREDYEVVNVVQPANDPLEEPV